MSMSHCGKTSDKKVGLWFFLLICQQQFDKMLLISNSGYQMAFMSLLELCDDTEGILWLGPDLR